MPARAWSCPSAQVFPGPWWISGSVPGLSGQLIPAEPLANQGSGVASSRKFVCMHVCVHVPVWQGSPKQGGIQLLWMILTWLHINRGPVPRPPPLGVLLLIGSFPLEALGGGHCFRVGVPAKQNQAFTPGADALAAEAAGGGCFPQEPAQLRLSGGRAVLTAEIGGEDVELLPVGVTWSELPLGHACLWDETGRERNRGQLSLG